MKLPTDYTAQFEMIGARLSEHGCLAKATKAYLKAERATVKKKKKKKDIIPQSDLHL